MNKMLSCIKSRSLGFEDILGFDPLSGSGGGVAGGCVFAPVSSLSLHKSSGWFLYPN